MRRTDTQHGRNRPTPTKGAKVQPDLACATGRSVRQNYLICIALFVFTVIVYFPVVTHPYVDLDDLDYVVDNPHVNTGLSWQNIAWALSATEQSNWHPLTWLSHALDCQIFGLYAGGHHLTSLVLHGLNAMLLFWLLERATGARWRSAMVASLFALHPLNVESVAWVAERKNLLCTLFFLLALGAYGWYAQNPQVKRYLCVAVLFGLGLASKPMVITLPFVLLLVDLWPLGRIEGWSRPSPAFPVSQQRFSRLVLEKLPLLALSAGSAIVTIIAQRTADALAPVAGWSVTLRLANGVHAYAVYFLKTFFPGGLALLYPAIVLNAWEVGLAMSFLLAVGWLVWRFGARHPYIAVGFLWFLGTLVPVIGLVQVGDQSMADRYTYIPCLGLFIAVVWASTDAAKWAELHRRWIIAISVSLLAVLSLLTERQLHFWKSSYDLWTHTLQLTVNNFVAEENLGNSLVAFGLDEEALPHFLKAEQIDPENVTARMNLGIALLHRGRTAEAIEHFEAVAQISKDPSMLASAYDGLGVANAELGERSKARKYFLQTLHFEPVDKNSLYNLGLLETEEGIDKLSALVSKHPTADGYLQLGQFLQQERRISEAQVAYKKALELDPNRGEAKRALQGLTQTN